MTEVKQKSISLLFQSDVSISYMLVVSTDFENGFAKTMQKVADLREKTEAAKRIASAMFSIPDMDAGGIENLCSTVVLGVDLIDALLGIVDVSV